MAFTAPRRMPNLQNALIDTRPVDAGLANLGNALAERRQRMLNEQIGQAAAGGNLEQARDAAYKGGNLQAGMHFGNALAQRRNQQQRLDLQRQKLAQGPGPASYGKNANYVQGKDGKFYTVHVASDGTRKLEALPDGVTPWRGVTTIDRGDSQQVISRGTGAPVREVSKNLRAAEEQKGLGRNDVKIATAKPLEMAKMIQGDQQLKVVDQDIDRALKQASGWTTGTAGSVLSNLPGTGAHDLFNTLETIRANIGFDKLQAMRNASPTGGALGQVSEFENRLLQSVQGALQQGQTKGQLVSNLRRVQRNLRALQRERRRAYEKQYGKADFSTAYTNPSKKSQGSDGFTIRRID